MEIIGLNKDNYKGIGWLMHIGCTQDADGKWNYDGEEGIGIELEHGLVTNGKLNVNFGIVKGGFGCSNLGLTTLKGVPSECEFFDCSGNDISIVEFLPKADQYSMSNAGIKEIRCDFPETIMRLQISNNLGLKSFKHFPKKIEQFYISECGFTSFEGCPEVSLYFYVDGNPAKSLKGLENLKVACFNAVECQLESLEYCPTVIIESDYSNNPIKNLKGIKGPSAKHLLLIGCNKLESLEGISPNIMSSEIDVSKSSIKTLEHIEYDVSEIRATNCNDLENVFFENSKDDLKMQINGENINMYTFFKMGLRTNNFHKDQVTGGQYIQISYHDTVSVHAGDVVTKIGWTEDEYFRDLFKHLTYNHKYLNKPKKESLNDIAQIKWYGDADIQKDIRTFVKSATGIVKFNL